jgi:hypothetical protein
MALQLRRVGLIARDAEPCRIAGTERNDLGLRRADRTKGDQCDEHRADANRRAAK